MAGQYILDADGKPVECSDLREWGHWLNSSAERVVEATELVGGGKVSTVFLGIDYNFAGKGDPVLWETMLFWDGHDDDQTMERYTSQAAAKEGHARWVKQYGGKLTGRYIELGDE
ncbi:hypothetical protein LCGC14_2597290 [marine sediment metagenome]|uniref:Uncharacterized protein n=1 Tax=marine sediment metagenome TaxID=412755 RepID=A0A0F9CKU2_9ZZZZ